VKWVRASAANRGQFYSQMVAKMVALPPVTQVNVAIDNHKDELDRAKLDQMLEAMVAQRVQYTIEQRAGITHQFSGGPDIDREIRENERRERQLREAMEAPIVIDAESNPPAGAADRSLGSKEPRLQTAANVVNLNTPPDAFNQKQVDQQRARERAAQLTPAQAKAKAMEPLPPIKRAPIDPASLRVNGVFIGHADAVDDNRSTTEKYLMWSGRMGPP
jgi:hypothetical protein